MMKHATFILAFVVLVAIGSFSQGEVSGSGKADHYDLGQAGAEELIVYSATWCGPCQLLKPTLYRLKRDGYQVTVKDVDKDELEFKFKSVPTLFYVTGGKPVDTETGRQSYQHIKSKLRKPE